jgi:hypothetical protein
MVRVLEMAVQGDREEMAKMELGSEKTSCVISSDRLINTLPGYD